MKTSFFLEIKNSEETKPRIESQNRLSVDGLHKPKAEKKREGTYFNLSLGSWEDLSALHSHWDPNQKNKVRKKHSLKCYTA
jgi:hypothetical protein